MARAVQIGTKSGLRFLWLIGFMRVLLNYFRRNWTKYRQQLTVCFWTDKVSSIQAGLGLCIVAGERLLKAIGSLSKLRTLWLQLIELPFTLRPARSNPMHNPKSTIRSNIFLANTIQVTTLVIRQTPTVSVLALTSTGLSWPGKDIL